MVKQVKLLSGISAAAYWGSWLLFDLSLLSLPFVAFTVVVAGSGVGWLRDSAVAAFVLLFALGIAGVMSLLYLLGFLVKPTDEGYGQRIVTLPFLLTCVCAFVRTFVRA
jgi:hypothetical protein